MGVEPILSVLQTEFLNRKNVSSDLSRNRTYNRPLRSGMLYLLSYKAKLPF